MGELEREVRRLRRQINQQERRHAAAELRGRVTEVDAEKRRVRVKIGETAEGEPVLSPWITWAEPTNSFTAVHSPMQAGDLVTVRSPSGVLGTASIAERLAYADDKPAPSTAADAQVEKTGELVITRRDGALTISASGVTWTFSAAGLEQAGGEIKHDGIKIDKEHLHTRVFTGLSLSGPPPGAS